MPKECLTLTFVQMTCAADNSSSFYNFAMKKIIKESQKILKALFSDIKQDNHQ